MKTKILLICSLILVCYISCVDEDLKNAEVFPYFTVVKDTVNWVPNKKSAALYKQNMKFSVIASIVDSTTGNWEGLKLNFSLSDALKGNISKFYAGWDLAEGWDMGKDHYDIDTLANNLITISAIDTAAKKISGTFAVHLIRAFHKPGTMFFNNGKFGFVYSTLPYTLTDPVVH